MLCKKLHIRKEAVACGHGPACVEQLDTELVNRKPGAPTLKPEARIAWCETTKL